MASVIHEFKIVDVFTDRPFAGNQLAVVLDAGGVPEARMQEVAREFGFSETTFVSRSDSAGCDWRVRIFTPTLELPMAGHPVVGTALVLHTKGLVGERTVFELGVGPVAVEIDAQGLAWMTQPAARLGRIHEQPEMLAAALSVAPDDIRRDLPARVVSTGNEFLMVPIASLEAMRRLRARPEEWPRALPGWEPLPFYCFSEEVEEPGASAHCRMFGGPFGIAEDAATGSAAGPLGCYLWAHVHGQPRRRLDFTFEQGFEMGRPSRIRVWVPEDGQQPRVGGQAALVAEGRIDLP
jgi:trans-2,3-dihydro-3-hydroxyanthranilate isomerase